MSAGITTLTSGRGPETETHSARKALVADARPPYDGQDAEAFKCPTCGAPSGDSCTE